LNAAAAANVSGSGGSGDQGRSPVKALPWGMQLKNMLPQQKQQAGAAGALPGGGAGGRGGGVGRGGRGVGDQEAGASRPAVWTAEKLSALQVNGMGGEIDLVRGCGVWK
jgi:hypothetical protein